MRETERTSSLYWSDITVRIGFTELKSLYTLKHTHTHTRINYK